MLCRGIGYCQYYGLCVLGGVVYGGSLQLGFSCAVYEFGGFLGLFWIFIVVVCDVTCGVA